MNYSNSHLSEIAAILKRYNLACATENNKEFPSHDCVENSKIVSAVLSAKEIQKTVLTMIGPKPKLGKKRKTRKKCQEVNRKYKEKYFGLILGLSIYNPIRGHFYVCQICNKQLPLYATMAKKIFKIEPLQLPEKIHFLEENHG